MDRFVRPAVPDLHDYFIKGYHDLSLQGLRSKETQGLTMVTTQFRIL
jgi:hypothetical protein